MAMIPPLSHSLGIQHLLKRCMAVFPEENDKPIDPITDFINDKAKAATAKAKVIAAEQEWSEDEVEENEGSEYDDEDVLELSSLTKTARVHKHSGAPYGFL
ncbi:hypothetical protein FRC11_010052, partial [Ceratobasidium sp. 423]